MLQRLSTRWESCKTCSNPSRRSPEIDLTALLDRRLFPLELVLNILKFGEFFRTNNRAKSFSRRTYSPRSRACLHALATCACENVRTHASRTLHVLWRSSTTLTHGRNARAHSENRLYWTPRKRSVSNPLDDNRVVVPLPPVPRPSFVNTRAYVDWSLLHQRTQHGEFSHRTTNVVLLVFNITVISPFVKVSLGLQVFFKKTPDALMFKSRLGLLFRFFFFF